jgi:cell division protein FtsI (penicillin-binding protein 3)
MLSRFNSVPHQAPPKNIRFFFIQTILIVAFSLLGARLLYVQVFMGDWLKAKAERQTKSNKIGDVPRNKLLDRNNVVLAESVQVDSCYVDPTLVKNKKQTAEFLSSILKVPLASVMKKLDNNKGSFVWIQRAIPVDASIKFREKKWPGVGLMKWANVINL